MSELHSSHVSPLANLRSESPRQSETPISLKANSLILDTPNTIDLQARAKLNEKDVQGCIDILSAGFKRWPGSALLCGRIIAFCNASGRYEAASEALDSFLDRGGESHEVLNKSLLQFILKCPSYWQFKHALPILSTLVCDSSQVVKLPGIHTFFNLVIADYLKHLARDECSQATFLPYEVKARELMLSHAFSSSVISIYDLDLAKEKKSAWERLVRAAAFFEVTSRPELADRLLSIAMGHLGASQGEVVRDYVLTLPKLGMLNAYGAIFYRYSKELFPRDDTLEDSARIVYREQDNARNITLLAKASLSMGAPGAPDLCLHLVNLFYEIKSDVNALLLASVLNAASPGVVSRELRAKILLRYLSSEADPNLQLCKDILLQLTPSSEDTEQCATLVMEKLYAEKGNIAASRFLEASLDRQIVPRISSKLGVISKSASQIADIQSLLEESKFERAWDDVLLAFLKTFSVRHTLVNRIVRVCLRCDEGVTLGNLLRAKHASDFNLDLEVAVECIKVANKNSNLALLSEVYHRVFSLGLIPPLELLEASHLLAISLGVNHGLINIFEGEEQRLRYGDLAEGKIASLTSSENLRSLVRIFKKAGKEDFVFICIQKGISQLCHFKRPEEAFKTLKLCLSHKIFVPARQIYEVMQTFYNNRMWSEGAKLFQELEPLLPSAALSALAELWRKSKNYSKAVELCDAALLNPTLNSSQREHALVVRLYALSFINREEFLEETRKTLIPLNSPHRVRFLCLLCFNGLVKPSSPEFVQYKKELKTALQDSRRSESLHADVRRAIAVLYKTQQDASRT